MRQGLLHAEDASARSSAFIGESAVAINDQPSDTPRPPFRRRRHIPEIITDAMRETRQCEAVGSSTCQCSLRRIIRLWTTVPAWTVLGTARGKLPIVPLKRMHDLRRLAARETHHRTAYKELGPVMELVQPLALLRVRTWLSAQWRSV